MDRVPINLSSFVERDSMSVYIYFLNMTPINDKWDLVSSWESTSTNRFEALNLDTYGRGTEFKWGNTTYTWSINITDGNVHKVKVLFNGVKGNVSVYIDDILVLNDTISLSNLTWLGNKIKFVWHQSHYPYDYSAEGFSFSRRE